MVKEVELKVHIAGCSAQAFFDIIYKDDSAARLYHKEVNHDEHITVTPWVDGRRTVEATMPVNLPDTVKKFIGTEKIPVVDTQELKLNGGDSFEVISSPVLQIPGGSRFTTGARVIVSNGHGDVCEIVAVVTCSATGIWGMQAFVEGIMAEQAKTGIQEFLDFCKTLVCSQLQKGIVHEDADAFSDVSNEFFDAQEASEIDLAWEASDAELHQVGHRSLGTKPAALHKTQDLEALLDKLSRDVESMSQKLDGVQQALRLMAWRSWGLFFLGSLSLAVMLVLLYTGRRRK